MPKIILSRPYFIIFSIILTVFLIFNIFWPINVYLGLLIGSLYILYHGFILGAFFLKKQSTLWQIFYGLLLFCSLLSLLGSLIYYFWQLNNTAVILIIILIFLFTNLISAKIKKIPKIEWRGKKILKNKNIFSIQNLIGVIYIFLSLWSWRIILLSPTMEPLSSPWQSTPSYLFIIYFFATLFLIAFYFLNKEGRPSLFLLMWHYFISFSAALFIFPLGFGFDPFIHQATEKTISAIGFIAPKPLYYLGQYSLVVILSKILKISIENIDKFLIPLSAAFFLPPIIYFSSKKLTIDKKTLFLLPAVFLSIPFTVFTSTTPQSLANLWSLIVVLFSFYTISGHQKYWIILILMLLAAITTHPLAGIPLLIFIILLIIQKINKAKLRQALTVFIFIFSIPALPLIFLIQSKISTNLGASIITPGKWEPNSPLFVMVRKFDTWLDFAYTYQLNWFWLFLAIAIFGYYFLKKHFPGIKKFLSVYWLSFFVVLGNYLLLKYFIKFQGLIYYEQENYADRLLDLSHYFLLPFFFYALYLFINKIKSQGKGLKFFFILILSAVITSSFYLSYPRHDDYNPSKGFNVSQSDIKAVRLMEENITGDYIVLANQIVSAAALKEFGFKKYYKLDNGEQFYYPLPTSSPLYNFYLKMVYEKASRKTMNEAMKLTGVNSAYLIINDYWWRAPIIIEEAKGSADEWISIDRGRVWIFKYIKH